MPSKNDSTAAVALDLESPVSCAIFVIRSCLFIDPSELRTEERESSWRNFSQSAQRLYATGGSVSSRLLRLRARECGVEDRILVGRRRAELADVGVVDRDGGIEALALDRLAGRREELRVGQPQPAVLGQLHQLLQRGAAERVLADEI